MRPLDRDWSSKSGTILQNLGKIKVIPLLSAGKTMSSLPLFRNRQEAGKQLAEAVLRMKENAIAAGNWTEPIIYGLPKGGVPIAEMVAQTLGCPLDVLIAKKITEPKTPELAIGAVSADGEVVYPRHSFSTKLQRYRWQNALQQAMAKAEQQAQQFAALRPEVSPTGKIAIVVDDGIATGMTMAAAVQSLRLKHPAQIWIAVPVAPPQIMEELQTWGDRAIVLETPDPFVSVGRFYGEFPQVSLDEAQICLLQQSHRLAAGHQ